MHTITSQPFYPIGYILGVILLPIPGTIMMSGCGVLTNGKGTRREYGIYNLDDLQVGGDILTGWGIYIDRLGDISTG